MNKIVFFDIDGTLLPEGQEHISENVLNTISNISSDCISMIATGRNRLQAKQFIEAINCNSYICSNGQLVVFEGEIIHQSYMPHSQIDSLVTYFKENDVHWAYENDDRIYLAEGESADEIKNAIQDYGILDVKIGEEFLYEGIYQMWTFGSKEQMDSIMDYLTDNFTPIRWSDTSIEIVTTGENKGNGISILLDKLGNNITTYAFGDGMNDLEMMKTVDYSIAMGNARSGLKEVCDIITTNCDEDGIKVGLKKVGLI